MLPTDFSTCTATRSPGATPEAASSAAIRPARSRRSAKLTAAPPSVSRNIRPRSAGKPPASLAKRFAFVVRTPPAWRRAALAGRPGRLYCASALSVTACVQAPSGSLVITGSEPAESSVLTVRS